MGDVVAVLVNIFSRIARRKFPRSVFIIDDADYVDPISWQVCWWWRVASRKVVDDCGALPISIIQSSVRHTILFRSPVCERCKKQASSLPRRVPCAAVY